MNNEQINILIVEDEPIIALDLSTGLQQFGYTIVALAETASEAIQAFKANEVDIVLMDIHLQGDKDGIDTVGQLLKIRTVPVIYLTSYTDNATIQRVKQTFPAAFLSKPYTVANVQVAIELALHTVTAGKKATPSPEPAGNPENLFQWNDHIFVKVNYRFIKIALTSILYLAAENNYIHLVTREKKHLLRLSLQQFMDKVTDEKLVRIHRSYIVHLDAIQSFTEQEVTTTAETLPIGRQYRDAFLQKLGWR